MENFIYHNPTKLIFGKGQIEKLAGEIQPYGSRILIVYGGGSIKRNGIYDRVLEELKKINAEVFELSGVEPNPRISTVRKGVGICREQRIDFILAIGGGSTIDCSKAIAVGAVTDADMWDVVTKKEKPAGALPFGTILTLAATGSEMNSGSVITNWETNEKHGWGSPYTYPKFSILDPVHTFSVPRDQTIYGLVDMMSHVLEHYFHHEENTPIQDRWCEGILLTLIDVGPKLLADPENYAYRSTAMLGGTLALNNMLNLGYRGDWATHNLEHAVSAVHDIPHGGGLAILFPNWMRYVLDESNVHRFKQLAVRVFDVDTIGKSDKVVALEGIDKLREFWNELGAPSKLADYDIDESTLEEMAEKTVVANPTFGNYRALTKKDSLEIFKESL
ncbi:putative NADH-dependent butanol dehydrogenase 1 [Oceanobacillus oncorhynchi subsp. incaldanensis]|uniref:iron-containing alcohol dehydrogenase n=1 Tax=Oceanobacillus oncorhynchi TaxID=545501 RepID=UPI001B201DB6|nr:iron-containing alcohol dehydrogenase [Oceanobacillus oncorhynchi]GIO19104.1 putative NADH-dependent butanol dehydrogenase 1 [Oceanobacillus oncorhynchi subsp. incaldanensis]